MFKFLQMNRQFGSSSTTLSLSPAAGWQTCAKNDDSENRRHRTVIAGVNCFSLTLKMKVKNTEDLIDVLQPNVLARYANARQK